MINRLFTMINIYVADAAASEPVNPFDIITSNNNVEALDVMVDAGVILRKFIIGAGVVMFIVCLISILLIRNNERMYEEKKNKAIRILVIVWLGTSAITIFNIAKGFIDGVF